LTDERLRRPGVAFLLSQLGGLSSREWTTRLAREGLEPREVMLFRFVALAEGQSQREVARAIGLPDTRIVALVDRLERRGWVERRPGARDRRSHALHLTAAGREVLARVAALSHEHEEAFTEGLSPAERDGLIGLLERVAANHGLTAGVHPGFADPRAEPGHAIVDDGEPAPGAAPYAAGPAPDAADAGTGHGG
jgi:DNA-binding MarR family transcriptional regulator